ncbi:hypothetical protein O181_118822 [Austropuccinia psidii MF-1]|uniref:Uncharacterized protein n=1 Tax=Austropuccinia psidii MF-1 TaxID=1389203 RepID=A0A9Q3KG20_9BASI|nr:hypothetical protein [Austropuccinia psidii MF-1]
MDGIHYHPNLKSKKEMTGTTKCRQEIKEEAPIASTNKPQASKPLKEGKKNKKKKWRKPYSPRYRIPRILKDAMENVSNMAGTLMEFKERK